MALPPDSPLSTDAPSVGSTAARRTAVFVVLDGVDGCGKTTQAKKLVEGLATNGVEPLHLREPGSTKAGEAIRALILGSQTTLGAGTLALLFAAARRETLEQLVGPALRAGRDVVIERFHASTFAYQGEAARSAAGAGAPETPTDDALLELLHGWAGAPKPTLEIVLDLDVETAFGRAVERADAANDGAADRFEARGLDFQRAVRRGLQRYVERTETATMIDAGGHADEVAARVLSAVLAAVQPHRQAGGAGGARA